MVGKSRRQELEAAGHTAAEIRKITRKECMLLLTSLALVILSHEDSACLSPINIYNPPQRCTESHIPVDSRFFQALHFKNHSMTAYKISQHATGTEDIAWYCISISTARKHETKHLPSFKHEHIFLLNFVLKLVGKVNSML